MELRRLRYFVAVVEEGTLTKAAARLHMTQPPLSRQIMELERDLGATLFIRSRRELRLTEAGELLLRDARDLLARADETREAVRRVAHREAMQIQVGFSNLAYEFLPTAISRYRSAASGASVELHELGTLSQIDALLEGRLHVGILQDDGLDGRFCSQRLRREPICVVVRPDHPLASRDTVSVEELADERLIVGPDGLRAPLARAFVDECRALGVDVRVGQQMADRKSVRVLVASGLGVSIKVGPPTPLRRSGLVTRPLVGRAQLFSDTVAAWRADRASPPISDFVDALLWASTRSHQPGSRTS